MQFHLHLTEIILFWLDSEVDECSEVDERSEAGDGSGEVESEIDKDDDDESIADKKASEEEASDNEPTELPDVDYRECEFVEDVEEENEGGMLSLFSLVCSVSEFSLYEQLVVFS